MRKTHNLPWMGRTVATAIMVLVGLGVFAGSAAAQGMTVYQFTDADAWWESFDCDAMRIILGSAGNADTDVTKESEANACKMTLDGLTTARSRSIEDFIDPATDAATTNDNVIGMFASTKAWWDAVGEETNQCPIRQALVGVLPIATVTTGASTDGDKNLFCRDYDDLRGDDQDMVDMVGMYLSGQGMPTDEAPALPLVGVGILGLLLAGRGAWLRRRA